MKVEEHLRMACSNAMLNSPQRGVCSNSDARDKTVDSENRDTLTCVSQFNSLRTECRRTVMKNIAVIFVLIYISLIQTVTCDGSYRSITDWQRRQEDDAVVSRNCLFVLVVSYHLHVFTYR